MVFRKGTKPKVAQREIVAAEFFRHVLGGSRTAHGKVIVKGDEIKGMYVHAVLGFISMRQLTELAKDPDAYKKIDEKIRLLSVDLQDSEITPEQFREKIFLKGAYLKIIELRLIDVDTKSVDLTKISGMIAKALGPAFYFQDWDRHKDNFGISFSYGELGVASLDYDKSLSPIFGNDNGAYDWDMTPQRLRDFPDFDCHYWPARFNKGRQSSIDLYKKHLEVRLRTASGGIRKKLLDKMSGISAKMYSEEEAAQYSALKDDPSFKRQAQIEWLKLMFIPKELRERAVAALASSDCEQSLKDTPGILEERRRGLIAAAAQLKSFRDGLKDESIMDDVQRELTENLSEEELEIVVKNWAAVVLEIKVAITKVETLEKQLKDDGVEGLIKSIIKKTGISFSPSVTPEKLKKELESISVTQSSEDICERLKDKLGLDVTKKDAHGIKQYMYREMIFEKVESFSGLKDILEEKFKGRRIKIKGKAFIGKRKTLSAIKKFGSAIERYEAANDKKKADELKKVIRCLRDLGIDKKDVSDNELKGALSEAKVATSLVAADFSLRIIIRKLKLAATSGYRNCF